LWILKFLCIMGFPFQWLFYSNKFVVIKMHFQTTILTFAMDFLFRRTSLSFSKLFYFQEVYICSEKCCCYHKQQEVVNICWCAHGRIHMSNIKAFDLFHMKEINRERINNFRFSHTSFRLYAPFLGFVPCHSILLLTGLKLNGRRNLTF